MAQKEIRLTKEGITKLQAELDNLVKVVRSEVADKIKRAREVGGTENNAEYDDAKNEQAFIEGRVLMLENMLNKAVIVGTHSSPGVVEIGDKVLISNQDGKIDQYTIVGMMEASPIDGKISHESPVGKALLGKKAGDKVEVKTPAGMLALEILEVIDAS